MEVNRAAATTDTGPQDDRVLVKSSTAASGGHATGVARKRKKVLSEDVYVSVLEHIIERDFFPELKHLRGSPTRDGDGDMHADADKEGGPPSAGDSQNPFAARSLAAFTDKYTSEDNDSFQDLVERAVEAQRAKFFTAVERPKRLTFPKIVGPETSRRQVLAAEEALAQRTELVLDDRPNVVDDWRRVNRLTGLTSSTEGNANQRAIGDVPLAGARTIADVVADARHRIASGAAGAGASEADRGALELLARTEPRIAAQNMRLSAGALRALGRPAGSVRRRGAATSVAPRRLQSGHERPAAQPRPARSSFTSSIRSAYATPLAGGSETPFVAMTPGGDTSRHSRRLNISSRGKALMRSVKQFGGQKK